MTPENADILPAEVVERHITRLSPAGLVDLFFRPRKFFSNTRDLDHKSTLLICASLVGIAGAMDRLDQKIIQAELGRSSKSWESTSSMLLTSWWSYWLMVGIAGLIGAIFIWYLGGWWYKKRLQWSGAKNPSLPMARRVYTFQGIVLAGPSVLQVIIQTIIYSNYQEAWDASELWSSLLFVFVFWSCWTSYVAATTAFQLTKFRARIWFLVLPVLLYVFIFGVFGTIYYHLSSSAV